MSDRIPHTIEITAEEEAQVRDVVDTLNANKIGGINWTVDLALEYLVRSTLKEHKNNEE
jgi:hypothetical protein